jgi:hypothetical protein
MQFQRVSTHLGGSFDYILPTTKNKIIKKESKTRKNNNTKKDANLEVDNNTKEIKHHYKRHQH